MVWSVGVGVNRRSVIFWGWFAGLTTETYRFLRVSDADEDAEDLKGLCVLLASCQCLYCVSRHSPSHCRSHFRRASKSWMNVYYCCLIVELPTFVDAAFYRP